MEGGGGRWKEKGGKVEGGGREVGGGEGEVERGGWRERWRERWRGDGGKGMVG